MKKIILALVLCLLLLCLTACGSNIRFASNEEMLQNLEGMWVVYENSEKAYYVFQNGQLYIITDGTYSAAVKNMLDSALLNGGLEALLSQNFDTISERLYMSDFTNVSEHMTLLPKKGEVKIYKDQPGEKSIDITENAVLLRNDNTKNGVEMRKLFDSADLSGENFQALFDSVVESYQIPTHYILMDPTEYGEMVKAILPNFAEIWKESSIDENSTVYKPIPGFDTIDGSLLISNKEVDLNYTLRVDSWNINKYTGELEKMHPNLKLYYIPGNPGVGAMKGGQTNIAIEPLISYCLYAVQNHPGAYTDPGELYNDMKAMGEKKTSKYDTTITMDANGLEYSLSVSASGTSAQFHIRLDDTILFKDIMVPTEEDNEESQYAPLQSGTLEQLLDGSKSWVGQVNLYDWEYNVYFVFEEDETFYFALGDTELYSAGVGTYTVEDGNRLSAKCRLNGEDCSVAYAFNPDEFSLTVTSKEGLVTDKGVTVYLQENTENDAEQVKGWAEMLAKGTSGGENEMWGD